MGPTITFYAQGPSPSSNITSAGGHTRISRSRTTFTGKTTSGASEVGSITPLLCPRVLKVMNLGIPTLMYGIAGLIMASHTEEVSINSRNITIYFWYKENRNSPN